MRNARRLYLSGAGALLLAGVLALALIVFFARLSPGVRAGTVSAELDFSIDAVAADGTVLCSSEGTAGGTPPNTCTMAPGATFTAAFTLNALPLELRPGCGQVICGFDIYDMALVYGSLTADQTSLVQQGPGVWPDCAFPAPIFGTTTHFPQFGTDYLSAGCSAIFPDGVHSPYTGILLTLDFQCPNNDVTGMLTLIPSDPARDDSIGPTDLGILNFYYTEAAAESLTINCGNPPTSTPSPTRTPGGATDTPTPTPTITPTPSSTPTPTPTLTPTVTPTFTVTPTPTRRPSRVLQGDVDGDLAVGARDALWVLWFDAQIVPDVPIPEAADVSRDDIVNAMDALYILWVAAGQIDLP